MPPAATQDSLTDMIRLSGLFLSLLRFVCRGQICLGFLLRVLCTGLHFNRLRNFSTETVPLSRNERFPSDLTVRVKQRCLFSFLSPAMIRFAVA